MLAGVLMLLAVATDAAAATGAAAAITVPVSGAGCNIGVWDARVGSCVCPPRSACMAVVVEPRGGGRPFRTACGAGQYLEHDL